MKLPGPQPKIGRSVKDLKAIFQMVKRDCTVLSESEILANRPNTLLPLINPVFFNEIKTNGNKTINKSKEANMARRLAPDMPKRIHKRKNNPKPATMPRNAPRDPVRKNTAISKIKSPESTHFSQRKLVLNQKYNMRNI